MAEVLTASPTRPIRVSELTRYLKYLLEGDEILAQLSVAGEVCEFSRSAAGHTYFAIKDSGSQINCVLFRKEAARQQEELTEMRRGVAVIVHGFITLYEPRSQPQIYVESVVVQGEGALFQRFERLRLRLESEGLFAPERKRPLPQFPRKLALVTSPGSQAYHDVLRRLSDQYPFVRVIEAGASVQGDGAAEEMSMALDIVNRLTDADVIVLARGGGAPEDLKAFNEERLARAIFASRIPVVTGIGHETDFTIADMVADHRAPTPSLAAAAAVPDVGGLAQQTLQMRSAMAHAMQARLRLERSRWHQASASLLRGSPQNRLRTQRQRADELTRSANRAMTVHLRSKRARMNALRAQLQALDPMAILSRGYAVLSDPVTGIVVSKVEEAYGRRTLKAEVSDGTFRVHVEER